MISIVVSMVHSWDVSSLGSSILESDYFFGQKACLNFIDYNIILDKHEILSWNQRTITKLTNVYIRLLWDISISPIAK